MHKNTSQKIAFGIFRAVSILVSIISIGIVLYVVVNGVGAISWTFLTDIPRDGMTKGGIFPAIVGTLILILGSAIVAFPVGILAGIYMSEYAKDNWFKKTTRLMTNNLAGVPSIVFGLFGMAMFVNGLGFGVSILSGCLTLGVLILPVVIRTTEESLKAINKEYRLASYGMGATKWQTIRMVILPMALPSIITGLILSIGRIAGETAAILFTVSAYYLPRLPQSVYDEVMVLPYHLYVLSTSGTDIQAARPMANGTALVLLLIVLGLNILANLLKRRLSKQAQK